MIKFWVHDKNPEFEICEKVEMDEKKESRGFKVLVSYNDISSFFSFV